jgi:uncharacterized protein
VPIEFDDQSVDVGNVDDRRGGGWGRGGLAIGGGTGIVGLVIYLIMSLLGGGGVSMQPGLGTGGQGAQGAQGESPAQLRARCNSSGALQTYTDCRLIKEFNVAAPCGRPSSPGAA